MEPLDDNNDWQQALEEEQQYRMELESMFKKMDEQFNRIMKMRETDEVTE